MKDFEEACKDLNIPLIVLPPRMPKYNGGVERGNRTFREEFYANKRILSDSLGALRFDLKHALHKYNSYRPHFALNGLTPLIPYELIQFGSLVLQQIYNPYKIKKEL